MIEVEPDCVQVTACIPRSSGFDLRLVNVSDRARSATLRVGPKPASVSRISLDGRNGPRIPLTDGMVRLELRPWEIATLTVSR